MTPVIVVGAVVSLLGVGVWLGLLIWAAKADGRVQAEHDRVTQAGYNDREPESDD